MRVRRYLRSRRDRLFGSCGGVDGGGGGGEGGVVDETPLEPTRWVVAADGGNGSRGTLATGIASFDVTTGLTGVPGDTAPGGGGTAAAAFLLSVPGRIGAFESWIEGFVLASFTWAKVLCTGM